MKTIKYYVNSDCVVVYHDEIDTDIEEAIYHHKINADLYKLKDDKGMDNLAKKMQKWIKNKKLKEIVLVKEITADDQYELWYEMEFRK